MLIPKKSLGQNFLIDKNICKKIINLSSIKCKNIIEIGPGTGQLTEEIIKGNPKKLILIEKDDVLINLLQIKYQGCKNIEFINYDAMSYDFSTMSNAIIFSNLPYNISTKLIFKLLLNFNNINHMIFMIQKEVAEKMNIYAEIIEPKDLSRLTSFDALFIRKKSANTRAAIASTIGTARGTTQGS